MANKGFIIDLTIILLQSAKFARYRRVILSQLEKSSEQLPMWT